MDYLKFIKGLFGWGKTGRIENEKEKKKCICLWVKIREENNETRQFSSQANQKSFSPTQGENSCEK